MLSDEEMGGGERSILGRVNIGDGALQELVSCLGEILSLVYNTFLFWMFFSFFSSSDLILPWVTDPCVDGVMKRSQSNKNKQKREKIVKTRTLGVIIGVSFTCKPPLPRHFLILPVLPPVCIAHPCRPFLPLFQPRHSSPGSLGRLLTFIRTCLPHCHLSSTPARSQRLSKSLATQSVVLSSAAFPSLGSL